MENEVKTKSLKEKILEKLDTGRLRDFFLGKWYPIAVAALVLLGHTLCIEVYTCLLNMLLLLAAILVCDSVRPLIITLCTFLWQMPLAHSPAGPTWSDYLVSGPRPFFLVLIAIVIVAILVTTVIKFKVFSGLSILNTPLLLSTLVLSFAFILNGAFSKTWVYNDLVYGGIQAVLFPFLFLIFYKGLKSEKDLSELGLYIAYVAAVMGVTLFLQMADLYIIGNDYYGTVFDEAGSVIKDRIHLGWATWNPAGISAAVLIPLCFYGAIKGKRPWAYIIAAVLSYLASVLTLSRNCLIFATLVLIASAAIACFVGDKKRIFVYRIIAGSALVCVAFFVIVFWREIRVFAGDIFNRGFSDNGRFDIWVLAIRNFKSSPVFGSGFYNFSHPSLIAYTPVLPLMAHQTFLELLSAMGFVGLLAYVYYRIDTAELFFKKPTLLKTMLGLSVLVLLLASLIDNFVFNIFTMFLYEIELAVVALIYEHQREECPALTDGNTKRSAPPRKTKKQTKKKKKK